MAAFRAVVVGCGAMSKGWLRAIAENARPRRPDLRRRPCRPRCGAGAGARRRVRPRARRRSAPISATMLEAQKPDIVFDVVVPRRAQRRRHGGARARRARPVREADGGLDGRGAGADRPRRRDAGGCMRSSRTAASSRACAACGGCVESGTLGRAHRRPLRLLHRRAFRRLPRRDGACAAARHGDPHLRRRALHRRHGAASRSIATRPTRRLLVRARRRGQRDLRVRRRRRLHLSRLVVRRGRQHRAGRAAGASSARKGTLLWDGADGFEAHVVAGDEGFLREPEAVAVPEPADAAETHGHASVIATSSTPSRRGRAPETVGHRQHQRASPWSSARSKAPRPASA